MLSLQLPHTGTLRQREAAADDLELCGNCVINFNVLLCIMIIFKRMFYYVMNEIQVCCKFTQLHSYQLFLKLVNI